MEKRPFITKEKLDEICAVVPTPFHLYDEKGIRDNAQKVNQAFKDQDLNFREYFAVKACPNPAIIKILKDEDCGLDCSSLAELWLAEACGVTGESIMFSSNETPDIEFKKAAELGAIINLDDRSLQKPLAITLGGQLPDIICARFNPGGIFTLGNGIMDNPGDAKYGMPEEDIINLFSEVRRLYGVHRFGLHAFLASNVLSDDYYATVATQLLRVAKTLREGLDIKVEFINLSGGVGIPYRPEDTPNDIVEIAKKVRHAYDEIWRPTSHGEIKFFAEMGRFMTGPYGCLVTRALRHKNIYKNYIGVDACAANLMRPAIYGAYHHITVAGKEDAPATETYDIVGSLCENNDKFAIDRQLPKIDDGDLLVIHDTGAHGFAMGYNYNGKLRSAEVLLKADGSFEVIRRAETLQDYFATLPEVQKFLKKHQ